jgi:hypothetical protein
MGVGCRCKTTRRINTNKLFGLKKGLSCSQLNQTNCLC